MSKRKNFDKLQIFELCKLEVGLLCMREENNARSTQEVRSLHDRASLESEQPTREVHAREWGLHPWYVKREKDEAGRSGNRPGIVAEYGDDRRELSGAIVDAHLRVIVAASVAHTKAGEAEGEANTPSSPHVMAFESVGARLNGSKGEVAGRAGEDGLGWAGRVGGG